MAHADFSREQASFWIRLVPFCSMWVLVAYSHFIAAFVRKSARRIFIPGYGYLLVVAALIALGYIPRGILSLGSSNIQPDYGPWLYLLTIGGAYFIATALFLLVQSYRTSRSPKHRNRIVYLLVGLSLLTIFGFLYEGLPQQEYALDHIGHLGNALVITYAILRYQLLDIKLVVKRGLVYSGVTVSITAAYLLLLSFIQNFVGSWFSMPGIGVIIGIAVVMAWLFNPIRTVIQKGIDKLFYGARYDYRKMVLSFSQRMSNILDLGELAEAMLAPITKAVRASQASLLLPRDDRFSSQFANRLVQGEPVTQVKLRKDSPIMTWLTREATPLSREIIDIKPEFKGLWELDRKALDAAQVEVLCPLVNKDKLIGVLALSKKERHGFYVTDDLDMLMTMASEAAVVIENAQLYAESKQRANTDELSGLFNHRCFHQRLDEEIARCSRFGETFSLLVLDLDLFKTYNDIRGHLEGDEILRLTSRQIKDSIRVVDIGFRYGGDEFAAILPHTSLDGARKAAERIRKRIEAVMDSKGAAITCSIGIASWPTDGVMREDIIRAADAALYYAKQTGRNRTHLASEVALAEVLRMEAQPDSKKAILSTIYALAATVDAKDHHTYGHSKKVAKYATEIAEALGYSQERTDAIRAAALLHDIGKIGISDQVLGKPGPLSPEEWEAIHAHPNLSVAIVKHIDHLRGSLAAIQYHHERYDGTGYPVSLKGDNIPVDALILAIADAYDAMTSSRPYRNEKLTSEQALEELKRCAGKQFDPRIVDVFVRINEQLLSKTRPAKRSPTPSYKEG